MLNDYFVYSCSAHPTLVLFFLCHLCSLFRVLHDLLTVFFLLIFFPSISFFFKVFCIFGFIISYSLSILSHPFFYSFFHFTCFKGIYNLSFSSSYCIPNSSLNSLIIPSLKYSTSYQGGIRSSRDFSNQDMFASLKYIKI